MCECQCDPSGLCDSQTDCVNKLKIYDAMNSNYSINGNSIIMNSSNYYDDLKCVNSKSTQVFHFN